MKTKLTILVLISVLTGVLVAQQQRSSSSRPSGSAEPDPRIVSKLSEIVDIRERLAKSYQLLLGAGRASADALTEVELAEARVDLARERGQRDSTIAELQGLVAAHERRTKRIADLTQDRVAMDEVERARAALLEAQVRLLRAQK